MSIDFHSLYYTLSYPKSSESVLTNLSVIYLGRRGGGASLVAELAKFVYQENLSQKIDFYISNSNENQNNLEKFNLDVTRVWIPHSPKEIFSKSFFSIKSILYSVIRINKRSSKVLFLMPSPLDWIFNKCIPRSKIKKYFVIHDAKPHLGEIWPSKKSLRWRFRSGIKLIALSEFVQKQILQVEKNSQIVSLFHPIFSLEDTSLESLSKINLDFNYSLFIGRIRKYKGVELLLNATKSFPADEFVIAGEGALSQDFPKNCHKINRWLNDGEIRNLMQNAQLIIFPYLEASQSGLLPIAMEYKKVIIVSNAGGLIEQTNGYEKVVTFEKGNLESLIFAISRAKIEITKVRLNNNSDVERSKDHSQEEFWKKLLSSIDFYG